MAQGTPEGCTSQFIVGQEFNPYKLFRVVCIPEALVRYRGVSPGAKLAFGRLMRYAGEDGNAFPAVGTLADELGVSACQARRYLHELEAGKFIAIVASDGRQNRYKFLWHEVFNTAPEPAPLADMRGVETPQKKNLETPQTLLDAGGLEAPPLADMRGAPLSDMRAPPLADMRDKESQCKESQSKRVSLSAREYDIVRGAIEHALGEIPSGGRTDGMIYDMLRHGRQHGLPPHALARFITWEVHERKIARGYRRIEVGLVHKMVLEDSVLWAKREANTVFRFQMEEEEWLANWLAREKSARRMPLSSEKSRLPAGKTGNQMA
jgi:hypothetical protein